MEVLKPQETNNSSPVRHRYSRALLVIMLAGMAASIISDAALNHYAEHLTVLGLMGDRTLMNLKLFGEYCSVVWLSLLIWLGTYHALSGNRRILSVIGLVLGFGLIEGYGLHLINTRQVMVTMAKIDTSWASSHRQEYEAQISDEKSPLASRSKLSKSYASLTFQQTGEVRSIVEADGSIKPYLPTQNDIRLRNQMLDTIKAADMMEPELLFLGMLHVSAGILSLVFGVICFLIDSKRLVRARIAG